MNDKLGEDVVARASLLRRKNREASTDGVGSPIDSFPESSGSTGDLTPIFIYNSRMVRDREDPASVRATQRRSWPVRKYRMGSEPSDDLSESTTAEQRLEMMWPLALEAWSFAGTPMPDYPRSKTPIVCIRRKVS